MDRAVQRCSAGILPAPQQRGGGSAVYSRICQLSLHPALWAKSATEGRLTDSLSLHSLVQDIDLVVISGLCPDSPCWARVQRGGTGVLSRLPVQPRPAHQPYSIYYRRGQIYSGRGHGRHDRLVSSGVTQTSSRVRSVPQSG